MAMQTLYLSGNLDKKGCLESFEKFQQILTSNKNIKLAINLHDVLEVSAVALVFLKDICNIIQRAGGKVCFTEATSEIHEKILIGGFILHIPFFSSPAFAQRFLETT